MNQHYIKYDTLISFHPLPITVPDTPIIRLRPDGLIIGAEMYRDYGNVWLDGQWSEIPKLPDPIIYKSDSIVAHEPLKPVSYSHIEVKPRTIVPEQPYPMNPIGGVIFLAFLIALTSAYLIKLNFMYEKFCNSTPINRAV